MALNITSITNHREREKGLIVYPVYSRRAEGLSIGINLFPDKKKCIFDCSYCEVFPFAFPAPSNKDAVTYYGFSVQEMQAALRSAIKGAHEDKIPIKDICFSGNGEPTLFNNFSEALMAAAVIRDEAASSSPLVIITNGTGLMQPKVFAILQEAALPPIGAQIWLKLDAGTDEWYKKINRSPVVFEDLITKIKAFVKTAPVTIQTMLCAIDGNEPPVKDAKEWECLVTDLALTGNIKKIQIYGKARPSPLDPLASALKGIFLEERAASLRDVFSKNGISIPVEIYP